MRSTQAHHTKIIAAVLAFFITAFCCAAIDVSIDSFSTGGSITGSSTASVSHSLISFVHTGIREGGSENSSRGQNLGRTSPSADILSNMARKLLTPAGGFIPFGSLIHFRRYLLFICISGCTYLFFPVLIRFIHLKDGSK